MPLDANPKSKMKEVQEGLERQESLLTQVENVLSNQVSKLEQLKKV